MERGARAIIIVLTSDATTLFHGGSLVASPLVHNELQVLSSYFIVETLSVSRIAVRNLMEKLLMNRLMIVLAHYDFKVVNILIVFHLTYVS